MNPLARALASLPAQKSATVKLHLAAAMKMTTSVSNGWLTQRLQIGSVGSLGPLSLNFERPEEQHAPISKWLCPNS